MQRLLRKRAQLARVGSAPSRQYTPEHPRDLYELELEPMGRHFGLGYMTDSDYMRALRPYEGLLQRYGCGPTSPPARTSTKRTTAAARTGSLDDRWHTAG
jgi:hypothetical protein